MKSLYRLSMEDHLIKEDVNYTVQDAIELATIERENEAACDAVEDSVEATCILTDRITINSKLSSDPSSVTEEMVQASNECLAYCLGKLNVDSQTFEQIRVSRESATNPNEKLQISTESIGKIVKKVFKAIGDVIKWIWETIKKFFKAILKLFGFYKSKKKKKKKQHEDATKALKNVDKEIKEDINTKLSTNASYIDDKINDAEAQLLEGTNNASTISIDINDFKQVFDNYVKLVDKFGDFKKMTTEDWETFISYSFAINKILNYDSNGKKFGFLAPLCVNDSVPKIDTIRSINKALKEAHYPNYIMSSVAYFTVLFDIDFEGKDKVEDWHKTRLLSNLSKLESDAFTHFYYKCAYKHFKINNGDEGVVFLTGIDLNEHKAKFKYYTKKDNSAVTEVDEIVADVDYIDLGETRYISLDEIDNKIDSSYYKQLEEAVTYDIDTSKAEKIFDEILDKMSKQHAYLQKKMGNTRDELNARPVDPVEAAAWDKNVAEMNSYSKLVNGIQSSTMGMMQYYKYSIDILSLYVDMVSVSLKLKDIKDTFVIPDEIRAKYGE